MVGTSDAPFPPPHPIKRRPRQSAVGVPAVWGWVVIGNILSGTAVRSAVYRGTLDRPLALDAVDESQSGAELAQIRDRLEVLIREADIQYAALPDAPGFRLAQRSNHVEFDPVLVAGLATVWLLATFPFNVGGFPRSEVLEEINQINSNLPFGLFYLNDSRLVFRNTIRVQSLKDSRELMIFVLVSIKLIEEISGKVAHLFA